MGWRPRRPALLRRKQRQRVHPGRGGACSSRSPSLRFAEPQRASLREGGGLRSKTEGAREGYGATRQQIRHKAARRLPHPTMSGAPSRREPLLPGGASPSPYEFVPQDNGYVTKLHACSLTRLCRERLAAARSPRDLTSLMSFNTLGFATLPPGRSHKDNPSVAMRQLPQHLRSHDKPPVREAFCLASGDG